MFTQINTVEAASLIHQEKPYIIDIRQKADFDIDRIPNAIHVSNEQLETLSEKIMSDTPILVYCYKGFSSQKAADILCKMGFTHVYSLIGGFESWIERNDNL